MCVCMRACVCGCLRVWLPAYVAACARVCVRSFVRVVDCVFAKQARGSGKRSTLRTVAGELGINFVEVFSSVLLGFGGPRDANGAATERSIEVRRHPPRHTALAHAASGNKSTSTPNGELVDDDAVCLCSNTSRVGATGAVKTSSLACSCLAAPVQSSPVCVRGWVLHVDGGGDGVFRRCFFASLASLFVVVVVVVRMCVCVAGPHSWDVHTCRGKGPVYLVRTPP